MRQKRAATVGPMEKQVAQLEARIAEIEPAQAERSRLLADAEVYSDAKRRDQLLNEYTTTQAKLDELMARWEAAQEKLGEAEAEFAAQLATLDDA